MIKSKYKNIKFTIIVFVLIYLFVTCYVLKYYDKSNIKENNDLQIIKTNEIVDLTNNESEIIDKSTNINEEEDILNKVENDDDTENWIIKIPEIDLSAEIREGTSKEVMNKFVGHFEETKIEYGNIGLAAHNRGYPVNYFQNLKDLKIGSEIIYIHGNFKMNYIVQTIEIIKNTDWNYLNNTKENCITLITCVENEPKYRRCIQGVEKIEREEIKIES